MSVNNDGAFFYVLQDGLQVLFVDDDPILREFALVNLASDNSTVDVAEDGHQALKKLDDFRPDIILVDLEMPVMDGFEFLANLRQIPDHMRTPVIVVTGREDVKAIDKAFQAGATSFVVKPINWRLLSYQIRFVDRAARAEQSLVRAQGEANARVMRVVTESSRFVREAVQRDPALRLAANEHAQALEQALTKGAA